VTASERLREALADAEHRGDTVPCRRGDDAWISEDLEDRREAARACTGCAVLSLCDAAARVERPSWTVRAGVDWGDRAQRPKRATTDAGVVA